MRLFTYNTATSWDTFLLNTTVDVVRTAGLQILMLFIAVAAIFAVVPYASALLSREGRSRFGLHAVVAALTTIALLISGRETLRLIARAMPSIASVGDVSVPDSVYLPLPALMEIAEAIFGAVVFAGAAALFSNSIAVWKNRWAAPIVTMSKIPAVPINIAIPKTTTSSRMIVWAQRIAAMILVSSMFGLCGVFLLAR